MLYKSLSDASPSVLKQLREEKGLSQDTLADKAGLHRTYISLLESGKRIPSLDTLEKIAIAINIEPYLLVKQVQMNRKTD